jgi:hypothetical protein
MISDTDYQTSQGTVTMKVSKKHSRKGGTSPVSPMDPQVSFTTKRSQKYKEKVDAALATVITAQRDVPSKATKQSKGAPAAHEEKDQPSILRPDGSTSKVDDNERLAEYGTYKNSEQQDGRKDERAMLVRIHSEVVATSKLRESPKRNDLEEPRLLSRVGSFGKSEQATSVSQARSSVDHPIVHKKKRGRPKKDILDRLPRDPLTSSKKKRGRPKKNPSEPPSSIPPVESFSEVMADPQQTNAAFDHPIGLNKKRGRPTEDTSDRLSFAALPSFKKKRGRPKKTPMERPPLLSPDEPCEDVSADEHPTDASGGSTTKGDTEQPRKGSDVPHSTAGQQTIPTKKRGRPKKDRSSEQSATPTTRVSKMERGAPGTKNGTEQAKRSRVRRPWKWSPCQECLACTRVSDCGKCAQCNAQIGKCILRQCIAPTRADVIVPRVVPSDDESLASPESDVSDMEWDVAFPKWRFGALSRKQLWQKLLASREVDEPDAEDGVCI